MKTVLVIGGGASGILAALTAAEDPQNKVLLLERQQRIGRKLLATGNGRCNLTNTGAAPERYHGEEPDFVRPALERFPPEAALDYFRKLGLLTVEEVGGRVYPLSNSANSVLDVLRFALDKAGVEQHCASPARAVRREKRGFTVETDEGALFAPGNMTAENYKKNVDAIFGTYAEEALKYYPGATDDEAWHGFGDAFRDMGFAWPSYAWVSLQAKTGKSPAYAAYLAQPSERSFSGDPRRRGVAHADDIMYLNGEFLLQPDKYPHESAVAEIIQQYWVNFIKSGNPNGKGLPYWPSFDESKPTTMQFSYGASLIMRPNREQIDFVDRFYKAKREQTETQRK